MPEPSSPTSQPRPSAVRTMCRASSRAATAPVPLTRTAPEDQGPPAANAVTASPTTVISQLSPVAAHSAANAVATPGSARMLTPATPTTPATTDPASRVPSADRTADPMAVAAAGPMAEGLPGPAVPRPRTTPDRSVTTAFEAVPPASTPSTKTMPLIEA
jgi:hypothetical protein